MTDRGQGRAYNDRNVYVMGAGFSQEAGLPLMRDFMNRMRDAEAWLEEDGERTDEINAINGVFDFRAEAAAAAYRIPLDPENIEDLFSLASAIGRAELSDQIIRAIAATLDFCRATAPKLNPISLTRLADSEWQKPTTWQFRHNLSDSYGPRAEGAVYSCPLYELYVGLLSGYFNSGGTDRRDTVISFNYDMVVEDALSALGVPYSYADNEMIGWRPPRSWVDVDRRPISILKLHGSINLAAQTRKGIDVSQLLAYDSYQELRRDRLWPLLVPPTWRKSLHGYFSAVWREAVSALRTATRIVILGYSAPETDQHFRYLMAAGLLENISLRKVLVVNPDESDRLKRQLSNLFRAELFEHNIVERVPRTVFQFLVPENGGHRFGRALKEGEWRFAN